MIDWILDNLIEKNRSRRSIIKKLKELGLVFKAPTRKSIAAGVEKHIWKQAEDILLKELYVEHRINDGMFYKIKNIKTELTNFLVVKMTPIHAHIQTA